MIFLDFSYFLLPASQEYFLPRKNHALTFRPFSRPVLLFHSYTCTTTWPEDFICISLLILASPCQCWTFFSHALPANKIFGLAFSTGPTPIQEKRSGYSSPSVVPLYWTRPLGDRLCCRFITLCCCAAGRDGSLECLMTCSRCFAQPRSVLFMTGVDYLSGGDSDQSTTKANTR